MGQRQVDLPESPSDLHSEFEDSQDYIVRFVSNTLRKAHLLQAGLECAPWLR